MIPSTISLKLFILILLIWINISCEDRKYLNEKLRSNSYVEEIESSQKIPLKIPFTYFHLIANWTNGGLLQQTCLGTNTKAVSSDGIYSSPGKCPHTIIHGEIEAAAILVCQIDKGYNIYYDRDFSVDGGAPIEKTSFEANTSCRRQNGKVIEEYGHKASTTTTENSLNHEPIIMPNETADSSNKDE